MVETNVSHEEARMWLSTLATLAGDDPQQVLERYLGEDGNHPNIPGIIAYANARREVLRDTLTLSPEQFSALSPAQKDALERFLIYVDYLSEEEGLDAAERDRRLRQALEYYTEENRGNPEYNFLEEIILAIARAFGLEEEARQHFNIRTDEEYLLESRAEGAGISSGTSDRALRARDIANSMIGQHESGGQNRGAIVRLVMGGNEGRNFPWCGGFVNYVMDRAAPGLFDQQNYMSALSYRDVAREHGSFREAGSDYVPNVGDVVVFTRGGQGRGHVGIVTDVAEDGTVTYVAGNDGNAVRSRTLDLNDPPSSMLGFADVNALAEARGVDMGRNVARSDVPVNQIASSEHRDRDFARG